MALQTRQNTFLFPELSRLNNRVGESLGETCRALTRLGTSGQIAAERLATVGRNIAQFTAASLYDYIDPVGTVAAIKADLTRSAQRLNLLRNLLALLPLLVTWVSLAFAVSQYQAYVQIHPNDTGRPFLVLWQGAFGTGNPLLAFSAVALTDGALLFLLVIVTMWSSLIERRASRTATNAQVILQRSVTGLSSVLLQLPAVSNVPPDPQNWAVQVQQMLGDTTALARDIAGQISNQSDVMSHIQAASQSFATSANTFREQVSDLSAAIGNIEAATHQVAAATEKQSNTLEALRVSETEISRSSDFLSSNLAQQADITQRTAQELQMLQSAINESNRILALTVSQLSTLAQTLPGSELRARRQFRFFRWARRSRIPDRIEEDSAFDPPLPPPGHGGEAWSNPLASAGHIEDPQFTSAYSREVSVVAWNTLLVYAHAKSALGKVLADLGRFRDEIGVVLPPSPIDARTSIAAGTKITVVPKCSGVTFNPPEASFYWWEVWHRVSFRFSVEQQRAGRAGDGEIVVYAGPLIIATLNFALLFTGATSTEPSALTARDTVDVLREGEVFISYSHEDTSVVRACRNAYKALGLSIDIDLDSLRAGDSISTAIKSLIDKSALFQLFWSANAAHSEAVRAEWEYALQQQESYRKRPRFIRPVYWEEPLVAPPPQLATIWFDYVPLPKLDTPMD